MTTVVKLADLPSLTGRTLGPWYVADSITRYVAAA